MTLEKTLRSDERPDGAKTGPQMGPKTTIGDRTIWYTRCPTPCASGIAIAGGWLDREFAGTGFEVKSLRASATRAERQTHFTHDHRALFRQGGVVPPLWAASVGTPVRLIGINAIPRFEGIISLERGSEDSGNDRLRGLTGIRIALPRRTGDEPVDFWRATVLHGVKRALAACGSDAGDVQLVDLPVAYAYHTPTSSSTTGSLWTAREAARLQRAEVAALVRGEVDAIYVYGPGGLYLTELLGATVVVDTSATPAVGAERLALLTVTSDLLEERTDVVVSYLSVLLRAADWAASNRSEAVRTLAEEEGVAEYWAHAAYSPQLLDSLRPELSPPLLEGVQGIADFLLHEGFLASAVDVDAWADPRPLELATERVDTPGRIPAMNRREPLRSRQGARGNEPREQGP